MTTPRRRSERVFERSILATLFAMMTLRSVSRWVVVSMALAVGAPASAQWDPSPSSAFGDADEDVLCGARILDDARIVVGGSASVPADAELLAGATSGDRAVLARLSHDGRELLGASRLPGAVWDLDGHGADLVVAAGDGGLLT